MQFSFRRTQLVLREPGSLLPAELWLLALENWEALQAA